MNIKFEYLYRDGGNYKQFGEMVFSNNTSLSLQEIDIRIRKCLIDGEWFYASDWGLKDLHLYAWDDAIDHAFHEYEQVTETNEANNGNDITDFLTAIEKADPLT